MKANATYAASQVALRDIFVKQKDVQLHLDTIVLEIWLFWA